MRRRLALACTVAVAVVAGGCGVLPEPAPALPESFVPDIEPSPVADNMYVSADGFSRSERISMRVRAIGCQHFVTGSAWVLDENTVVTNRHVVEDTWDIEVTSHDGVDYTVTDSVIAEFADLALLTVDAEFTEFAQLAEESPERGEVVSIVGYPEGWQLTTSTGEYRALVTETIMDDQDRVLEIDAPSKSGNSGSPVVNEDHEVVGVLYAGDDYGTSYAVTLSSLSKFLDDPALQEPNDVECDY